MKDNFSTQSEKYAKYRPTYPSYFFDYLNSIVQNKRNAWDCGTGNGQVAYELAKTFDKVFATDISQSQIDNSLKKTIFFIRCNRLRKPILTTNYLTWLLLGRLFTGLTLKSFIKK